MQKFFILFYCLLFFNKVIAQGPECHVEEYTTENGLPSNGIKGMQWDEKTEFLWMATEAGIVRFNGVDFRSYTNENMPSIASERMLFITRNNAGSIYISDDAGNIFSIRQNKPVLWKKSQSNANPYYSNYYLLPVSDSFFQRHDGVVPESSRFSAITSEIVPVSDSACLILNFGELYYQSLNLVAGILLPFQKNSFATLFKIGGNCFVANQKNEAFLFNPAGRSLARVAIKDENGILTNIVINNSHLFWEPGMPNPVYIDGENAWLLAYEGGNIVARLIFTGLPSDVFIKSIQYSEKNEILFIGTDSKGLIVVNQNRVQSKKERMIIRKTGIPITHR